MRQLGNLNLFVIFSISFLINESFCLYCWRCSSEARNTEFCGATLESSNLTDKQKHWVHVQCTDKPPHSENNTNVENLIPKCKILLQLVNDKEIYSRSCDWELPNVPSDSCKVQNGPSFVKTIECRTCVTDGCNDRLTVQPEKLDNIIANTNNNNATNNNNSAGPAVDNTNNNNNSAVSAVVSHTVLFVVLMFSMVIVY